MVIDYTSGDYINLHIENVESWRGEANGLTIYKESYINLQNVLINNINAGTKLNENDVSNLVLPNLIPRACAVDIHDGTVIKYLDGDDIDNIRHYNIFGFQTCDQFGANNNFDVINGNAFLNNKHLMNVFLGIIIIIMCAFVILFIYRIIKYIKRDNNNKGNNNKHIIYHGDAIINKENNMIHHIINEKTPLLDTI